MPKKPVKAIIDDHDMMLEWDIVRNNGLGYNPEEISIGSKKKVWWKCSSCGFEWETTIRTRTNGHGCPNYRKHIT